MNTARTPKPIAPAAPSKEELLLTEIRDLLARR
jgi:large-conductance mechanosensitive channel